VNRNRIRNRNRRRSLALVVACSLVLAGCAAPVDDPGTVWSWPEDPPTDRLGWEAGVWYNESIAVDQSDGLNESEREVYVARTMARVEVLRQLEFTETVPVEIVDRGTYRNRTGGDGEGGAPDPREEQTWEALFLVGEDRTVDEVFAELYGESVLGYYSPGADRIVLVSESTEPGMARGTLAHELVHALQDQRFGLPPSQSTRDAALARNALVEGDATYVERLYQRRCRDGDWECVANPPGGGGGGGPVNQGVLVTVLHPYSDGPTLVHRVRERGGWAAVDAMYDRLPVSTEQVVHPERYPGDVPVTVDVPDRSDDAWRPVGDPNTLGEVSVYVMFWANHLVPEDHLTDRTGPFSYYNYSHPRSAGWAGDSLVAYEGPDGGAGYVWTLAFDTEADARQFVSGYELMLKVYLRGQVVDRSTGVYELRPGPFADAIRVTRDGTRVTIVNAPTVADLDRVHRP
jgi:hypothetical protein